MRSRVAAVAFATPDSRGRVNTVHPCACESEMTGDIFEICSKILE